MSLQHTEDRLHEMRRHDTVGGGREVQAVIRHLRIAQIDHLAEIHVANRGLGGERAGQRRGERGLLRAVRLGRKLSPRPHRPQEQVGAILRTNGLIRDPLSDRDCRETTRVPGRS